MTRTINLLFPEALERLQAERPACSGKFRCSDDPTDQQYECPCCKAGPGEQCEHIAPDPEPLPGVAGWEGAPLSATVDCGTCQHRVAFGECCQRCDANCSLPASPVNEEK